MTAITRRELLTSSTTAAALPAFLGLDIFGSSDDSEDNDLEYDDEAIPQFPDHITETRDGTTELENYQPRLVVPTQQARSDMQGMYGWVAESEEYDVTAHYYWVRSHTQRSMFSHYGIDAGPEEHHKDHEPILVFENPDGTVDKVVFSGGHHMASEFDEWGHIVEDRVADRRTHPVLRQVRPHNHFMEASVLEDGTYVQGYSEFGSWLDQYRTWYRNGRYDKTADVAVMDPFVFYPEDGRQHWWRSDTRDAWFARNVYVPATTSLGESRDELRYE